MQVDLRSDTVTQPTPEMKAAMVEAPLGDDVLGDEPTVQALEAKIIELTGMEAAVFVPSGTMGNQIGIAALTSPGDSILVEEEAHILHYEVGALAVLNGLTVRSYSSNQGKVNTDEIRAKCLAASLHTPGTTLLCLENTHNRHGGSILTPEDHAELRKTASDLGVKVHLDGARLFNASASIGKPIKDFTQYVDSVSLCLSKGLGAPVGSVLAGSADHIERARIWRKRLGGGMRQSGMLAAAGIYGLDHIFPLLAHDHAKAKRFSQSLNEVNGWSSPDPETNIVMLDLPADSARASEQFANLGIRAFPFGPKRMRFVFHHQVSEKQLVYACEVVRKIALGEISFG